ncbi:MAG: winged helix-turn-helix domain-containing protein [Lachnospiraceae bacterium]
MKEMNIVEAAPIRDQVADILRKRIISGDLANGEKLSERQISAELNISTTPVKEAFRLLQAEGLIYTLPRKDPLFLPMHQSMPIR